MAFPYSVIKHIEHADTDGLLTERAMRWTNFRGMYTSPEKRGISHKVCSFVIPLGATLNMDATAMFQTVAVIFLTQAYGVILDPLQIVAIGFFAIVASSTCAGIPGAGIITIAIILNGLGLSNEQLVEGFAFLFAIDRVIDMFRTMLNVTSDTVVAAVVADNENEINYEIFNNIEEDKDILE